MTRSWPQRDSAPTRRLHRRCKPWLSSRDLVTRATQRVLGLSFLPMGMNAPDARQNHQLLRNIIHWLGKA